MRTRRTIRNTFTPTPKFKSSLLSPDGTSASRSRLIPASFLSIKSVFLYDWWLVKAKDKGLAVAGLASRENSGIRLFCSAAIAKRHGITTLETIDGMTVTISGFINKSRSLQNGIPLHVCNQFHLGFPYSWEEHASKCFDKESSDSTSLSISLDDVNDLSETRIRDLLSVGCTLDDDILVELCSNVCERAPGSDCSGLKNKSPVTATNSVLDATPVASTKDKADQEHRDVGGRSYADKEFTLDDAELCGNVCEHLPRSDCSGLKNESPVTATNSVMDPTPVASTKDKADQELRDAGRISEGGKQPHLESAVQRRVVCCIQANADKEFITPRIAVATRSLDSSGLKNQTPVTATNSVLDATPVASMKDKVDQEHRDVGGRSNTKKELITPRIGVVTRSMSRLRNHNEQPDDNIYSNIDQYRHLNRELQRIHSSYSTPKRRKVA